MGTATSRPQDIYDSERRYGRSKPYDRKQARAHYRTMCQIGHDADEAMDAFCFGVLGVNVCRVLGISPHKLLRGVS